MNSQLKMPDGTIKLMDTLLGLEGARIINGGTSSDIGWKYYIPGHVLLFDGIQSIEEYLEKRLELDKSWNRIMNPMSQITTIREQSEAAPELNMWEKLHPSVRQEAQAIAEAGRFDDAIFAAF